MAKVMLTQMQMQTVTQMRTVILMPTQTQMRTVTQIQILIQTQTAMRTRIVTQILIQTQTAMRTRIVTQILIKNYQILVKIKIIMLLYLDLYSQHLVHYYCLEEEKLTKKMNNKVLKLDHYGPVFY